MTVMEKRFITVPGDEDMDTRVPVETRFGDGDERLRYVGKGSLRGSIEVDGDVIHRLVDVRIQGDNEIVPLHSFDLVALELGRSFTALEARMN